MQLARRGLRGEDEADDEAVQAQGLREDEDEHHADEELRLLRRRARTPASPTMPIAIPAAIPERPQARPAARWA